MNKRLAIVASVLIVIGLLVFSVFLLKPPKPIIDIKGERLLTISDLGNDAITVAITNTLFTAWVAMALLLALCFFAIRKRDMVPSGIYNLFEALLEGIMTLCTNIAGERNARRFFPLIATLFIYIAFANWLSLTPIFNTFGVIEPIGAEEHEFHSKAVVFDGAFITPGAKVIEFDADKCKDLPAEEGDACREEAITKGIEDAHQEGKKVGVLAPYFRGINTDLMTPLSFALVAVFFIEYWGITTLGFGGYMKKFINFSSPLDFFVGFLESIAELAKIISFSFRLFGNMMAGEILLLVMSFLVGVTAPILVIFYGLELFVGGIQAFVFGTLTLVFAVLAVSTHGGQEHEEHAHAEEHAH